MKLKDRWNECYEGPHREVSPEEFKNIFCANCMNASCSNSKGSGMSWVQRMATQSERLLDNPNFAHNKDPEFQAIRNMDFKSMLHREIALNISTQKGDWEVPSEIEVSMEAGKLVGKLTGQPAPMGFKPEQDLNPSLLEGAPEPEEDVIEDEPTQDMPFRNKLSEWRIKGKQGTYIVSLWDDQEWECTCPYFLHKKQPCKHIMDAQKSSEPIKEEPQEESKVVPRRPPPITSQPSINTSQNQGGYIIGGDQEKAGEPSIDPWAAPKEKPTGGSIPVGGTFTFGSKKK